MDHLQHLAASLLPDGARTLALVDLIVVKHEAGEQVINDLAWVSMSHQLPVVLQE
jgi:hypothetical protein